MKTISWSKSKLVLFGSVLFLSSFFFGGQAKAAPCIWTAGAASTSLFSDQLNWNDGAGCSFTSADLLSFGAASTKNVVFDLSTTTPTIIFEPEYTGIATVTSSVTVTSTEISAEGGLAGIFMIASGGTLVVSDNVFVSSSASFQVEGTLKIGGDFTVTSTLTSAAGTVVFTSTTAQTISGPGTITFYNLVVNSGGNTVTAASSITTNGNLVISSGNTFDLGLNGLIAGGNIDNSGTFTQSSSTVLLTGSGVTIGGSGNTTFYNLSIEDAGTLTGNVTTTNNFTLTSVTSIFVLGTSSIIVGNTFTNDGDVSQTSGTVTMSGVGSLAGTGSTQLAGLIITGTTTLDTVILASTTLVSGVFNGGTDGDILTLTGAGSPLTITGTFNPSAGKIKYSGVSNITTSTTYFNLESSGTQSLNGNITVGANFTSTAGSVTQTTGTVSMTGNAYSLGGVGNSTFYNLTVATTSLAGNVTTTKTVTVNGRFSAGSRTLTLSDTGTPFVINTSGSFIYGTSNIVYSGANVIFASTTYYNLTLNSSVSSSLAASTTVMNTLTIGDGILYEPGDDWLTLLGTGTPLSNSSAAHISTTSQRVNVRYSGSEVNVAGGTYYNLEINSASSTLIGNITVRNILTVNSGKTLNGSSYAIDLSVVGTPFALVGTFVASDSTVNYTGATAAVAETTYATLNLGTGAYTLAGTDVTTTVAMTNDGTLIIGDGESVIISSGSYTNNATTTLTGTGKVKKDAAGGLDPAGYTSGSANGQGNLISISITDPTANLLASTVETFSVTTSPSTYSDLESILLTETSATSGIFSGTIYFNIANAAAANSLVDVSGNGTLSLVYTNGYGVLTGTGSSVDYTGSAYQVASVSSGGGSSAPATPPTVSATTAATISAGAQTTSQTITLNLSATNAIQVAISEDPGFAGASWDTYTPTKSFTLSKGAGEKTIYVKFRSASGGVTNVYKVNVTLKSGYEVAPVTALTDTTKAANETSCAVLVAGDLVKTTVSPVIYAVNADKTRSYFPQGDIYKSWTADNKYTYKTVSQDCLSALKASTAVLPRSGTYLVKEQATNKVYTTLPGNKLVEVSADVAKALYGAKYALFPAKGGHTITMDDPSWTFYQQLQPAVAPAKITNVASIEGALVKVGTKYYVLGANKTLTEVTAAGLAANRFQTKFAHTLTSTTGYTVSATKVEAQDDSLSDRTQGAKSASSAASK